MIEIETPAGTGAQIDLRAQLYLDSPARQEEVVADHAEPEREQQSPDNASGFRLPESQPQPNATAKNRKDSDDDKDSSERVTQKQLLLSLTPELQLWRDPDGVGYATIVREDVSLNVKIRSKDFREYLDWLFFEAAGTTPSSYVLEDISRTLEARAKFASPEYKTHVRIAGDENASCVHLADRAGTVMQVTGQEVRTIGRMDASDASIRDLKFLIKKGLRPLPMPVIPGTLDEALSTLKELRKFCNLQSDTDWLLFLVSLLSAYRPMGPFVVVVVVGEQGSAKSTLCKIFRRLVDPSAAPLRSAPREERDLWIAANNGWLVVFDNVSYISNDMSDAICRLATGGGNSYRTLYENDAETLFQAQRLVMLNTIDDLTLRGDMVDRAVQLNCKRIADEDRKSESEFWTAFEQSEATFLGALLVVLSRALKELPNVRLAKSPRMADFARFGVAVERALGLQDGTFMSAYGANRQNMAAVATEDQLAQLVLNLQLPWETTANDLWLQLLEQAGHSADKCPRWFPKNGQQLSGRLRRLAPLLRQQGISIEFRQSGTRKISITRLQEGAAR